jgi:hypothetical protein
MTIIDLNHRFEIEYEITIREKPAKNSHSFVCNHFYILDGKLYIFYTAASSRDDAQAIDLNNIADMSIRVLPYNPG